MSIAALSGDQFEQQLGYGGSPGGGGGGMPSMPSMPSGPPNSIAGSGASGNPLSNIESMAKGIFGGGGGGGPKIPGMWNA